MNVASLELCKELYELSGWNNASYIHECLPNKSYVTTLSTHNMEHYKDNWYYPAYDLGFLIRKLPPEIKRHELVMHRYSNSYDFCYEHDTRDYGVEQLAYATADAPEDALCNLAIKLFEEGILNDEPPRPSTTKVHTKR